MKRQKLILQADRLEGEREAVSETSSKLETWTHYVTNSGYTSYSAPNFFRRHFSAAVPSFPVLLKSMASLPTLGC